MSTPKTNLVVLVGGGLLAANVIFDKQFDSLRLNVSTGKFSTADVSSSPVKMALVGLLTLVALTVIADASDSAADTILIALIALWILWYMSYKGINSTTGTTSTTTSTKAKG